MHTTRTRVRYGETDQMNVVYHANYLVYFEIGRTELIRDVGATYSDLEREGLRLPVIEAGLRFRKPARYDDVIVIGTRLTDLSAARVRFDYEVTSEAGELLAEGHTVLACMNVAGKPRRFPPDYRRSLEKAMPDRPV